MLYEKLSDEFKDPLVIVKKAENLNNLILLLCDIDANMKKISKQSQLHVKPNVSNFSATKPPFMSYNSAPTKLSTPVGVAIISPVFSITTGTHLGFMDVFSVIRQRPISQKKKDRYISLGLCHYCGESGYIAIDHRNPALLATKKEAADALTGDSVVLVSYKPLPVEEKKTSLG